MPNSYYLYFSCVYCLVLFYSLFTQSINALISFSPQVERLVVVGLWCSRARIALMDAILRMQASASSCGDHYLERYVLLDRLFYHTLLYAVIFIELHLFLFLGLWTAGLALPSRYGPLTYVQNDTSCLKPSH